MCMFSGEVKVSNTNIFVTLLDEIIPTQFTVYSNTVVFDEKNPRAMILPIPIPKDGNSEELTKSIKMVDMTNHADFFKILHSNILRPRSMSSARSSSLRVYECGSYQYSVVPDLKSMEQLDQSTFVLSDRLMQTLTLKYSHNFAFLVCVVKKSATYSPIAYIHASDCKTLFVPTYHEHGHSGEEEYTDDWDHSVYSVQKSDDKTTMLSDNRELKNVKFFHANPFSWYGSELPFQNIAYNKFICRMMKGKNANGDIIIKA